MKKIRKSYEKWYNLISQVTFIYLTQIYYNMNFMTLSSNFITRFPRYSKINLRRLLLKDNFLAHKKWIFLNNMSAKLVLRIRNFVKMQGNLWKISCSLQTLLKILFFHNFFYKFFEEHQFANKNQNVPIILTFMTSKYLTSNTTFSKKVNPMKHQIQTYILVRTSNLVFMYFTGASN